jgi:putative colanic acid biosynthesis acetyltransferase WcaF
MTRLDQYDSASFDRGKPKWFEALWLLVDCAFVRSSIPGTSHRRWILTLFGARIGNGVVIKPGVRVKFPWRLTIGAHSWIGEDAWIDNLSDVAIGSHCCISQGAYLCTGNHDWSSPRFDLKPGPITIEDNAWIAAKAVLGPNSTVGQGAVLTIGSVAVGHLKPWTIYNGNQAVAVGSRSVAGRPASLRAE